MNVDARKGASVRMNGDAWVVVDVAPAEPLADMVAALLEDEGIVAVVRGAGPLGDVASHLGSTMAGTTVVLVPERDASRALTIIADTVTDYEGEELEALLASGELETVEGDAIDDEP